MDSRAACILRTVAMYGPTTAYRISTIVPHPTSTVYRLLRRLEEEGLVDRIGNLYDVTLMGIYRSFEAQGCDESLAHAFRRKVGGDQPWTTYCMLLDLIVRSDARPRTARDLAIYLAGILTSSNGKGMAEPLLRLAIDILSSTYTNYSDEKHRGFIYLRDGRLLFTGKCRECRYVFEKECIDIVYFIYKLYSR